MVANPTGAFLPAEQEAAEQKFKADALRKWGLVFNALFTLNGQHSSDPLVAVQQFGMGGPNSIRAYPTSAYLADKGQFYSLELTKPINNSFQVSVFADYGKGKSHDTFSNEPKSVELGGAGIGMRLNLFDNLNLNFTAAWALGSNKNVAIGGETIDGQLTFGKGSGGRDSPMLYLSLLYDI